MSGTVQDDVTMFYSCRRHKLATKARLCNTQYFYAVELDKKLNDTHRTQCYGPTVTIVTRTRHNVTLQCTAYLLLVPVDYHPLYDEDSRFPRNVCTHQTTPLHVL